MGVTGTALKDPLVVQVNDDQGTAVPGALVEFHGPAGVSFDPAAVLTDSSGQATTSVTLGDSCRTISDQCCDAREDQAGLAGHCRNGARLPAERWEPSLRTSIAAAATIRSRRPSAFQTTTTLRSSRIHSLTATR